MRIDAKRLRDLATKRGLTNTGLAAKAGITRQALQTMLRAKSTVEIRDKTLKGLVHALDLGDENLLLPDPLARFRRAVADENAHLDFVGLGLSTADPKSMDDVYVPIMLVPAPGQTMGSVCQPLNHDHEPRPIKASEELPLHAWLTARPRLLLRGDPGSGKTTTLRQAARAQALGRADTRHPAHSRTPLLIRLADFAKAKERDPKANLIRFVVTRTLPDATADYWVQVEQELDKQLRRGACLVLLDGLDEVGPVKDIFSYLNRFIAEFRHNHFVVTSRSVGLDPEPWQKLGFELFQIAPWREDSIRTFVRSWYVARPRAGKNAKREFEQAADELTELITRQPALEAIASNPLMLTILAALHYSNSALPRRRVDLYAKIAEVMLETWEATQRGARPGDPLHGIILEAREFGWLLGRLALSMQRDGLVLRPRWWMTDFVQQFLRDALALEGDQVKAQSERVIRYLCERAGLLVERGDGVFSFGHRTFQEYFAARGLLLEAEDGADVLGKVRPYLFHPLWEEVVIYLAASLSAPRATALLRVILDDPDPAGRFLHRGQRLALRCLIDGAAIADRAVLNQIFSDGDSIGRSRWWGISSMMLDLLKQLLPTRHEPAARRMLDQIENAAKAELPEADFLHLYLTSHDPPLPPPEDKPGTVCQKNLGGRKVQLVWSARQRRLERPQEWYAEALARLRDPRVNLRAKRVLISLLGEEADTTETAKYSLHKLLRRDPRAVIRATCAEALATAASTSEEITRWLMEALAKDKSDTVRAACALALRHVAPDRPDVQSRLEGLFTSGSQAVRGDAVRALSEIDLLSEPHTVLLNRILNTIQSPSEPGAVRGASISAVASHLDQDRIARAVEECLSDPDPAVAVPALHAFADGLAEGKLNWRPALVDRIETLLMSVARPCIHLLGDLVALVAMKELRGARGVERVLGDALRSLDVVIRLAFIFGSVARAEQVKESDVDLLIVGDVRLTELATALHPAEQVLGRVVNPVLFSAETFREQYRQGNPLILDVVRKDKVFIKGNRDELRTLVADGRPD